MHAPQDAADCASGHCEPETGEPAGATGDDDEDSSDAGASPWDGAAGYTPLTDLSSSPNSTVVLSAGPDMEGAFYADMSVLAHAYRAHQEDDEDDDKEDENGDRIEGDQEVDKETDSADQSPADADVDFRALADRALRALDEEYHQALRETVTGGGTAEQQPPQDDGEALPPIRLLTEDFGSSYFPTTFEESSGNTGDWERSRAPEKVLPQIDTEAVRRVVGAIRLKDAKLNQNYSRWEAKRKAKLAATPPKTHPLVAPSHLRTFRRHTPNAIHATTVLSRAATVADALVRLGLINGQGPLQIDILGCDGVECESEDRMRQLFQPLARWIGDGAHDGTPPRKLRINLIGPNLPATAPRHVQLPAPGCLESVDLYCQTCVYEARSRCYNGAPCLLISFHAGIWGYKEWQPTLQHLAELRQKTYFVVTAYTVEEAEDDAEVIQEVLSKAWRASKQGLVDSACIWEPQPNPFASQLDRETASAVAGRRYRENAAWQAWCI